MRSSGLKRGLATTAVTALAVTGVPTLASATPVADQVGSGTVVLYTQFNAGNEASARNDGTDATIRLAAGAGSDVGAVTFQYAEGDGQFQTIRTVTSRNDDGLFIHEWTPPTALRGATVTLRAAATVGATTVADDQAGVEIGTATASDHAVNLTSRSRVGVFRQPDYSPEQSRDLVRATGTTSATSGTVTVSRLDGAGVSQGSVQAPVTVADGAATGTFEGLLDITGYPYDPSDSPVDQLVVGAERDTDDVEGYTLYQQAISTVTATADRTRVPSGQAAVVTVTVTDAEGTPIPGAEVRSSAGGDPRYTDVRGVATFEQAAGAARYYYANATASDAYEASAGDKRSSDVTVEQYSPAPTTLHGTSADGAVFDRDESGLGDITVQVRDQAGRDLAVPLRAVSYYWVITPFDGSPATVREPSSGTRPTLTNGDGEAVVPLPSSQEAGTYELHAALAGELLTGNGAIPSRKVLTLKTGEAVLGSELLSPVQTPAGGSRTIPATYTLEDGTGLPGRQIALTFGRGTESGAGADDAGDAGFATGTAAPVTTHSVTTGADGRFSVTVTDPAESPQPEEKGGSIAAAPAGNRDAAVSGYRVDFLRSTAVGRVEIAAETPLSTAGQTPGRPVSSRVTVSSTDGTPLANQVVTLRTGHGFFTPYAESFADLQPAAQPAAGQDAGAYRNSGPQLTVTTDAEGVARFTLAIERDRGFDDDGSVAATVTATVGSLFDTETVDWTSADPYNGGEVRVELARAARQESGVLPKAPTSDTVLLDVFTEDQFGNLVGGETVRVGEASETAALSTAEVTSDFDTDGDVVLSATGAGNVESTGTWQTETNRYGAAPALGVTPGTETLTGKRQVEYYAVDPALSTYNLDHSGANTQRVGSAVTSTYTATDQLGEPIADLWVRLDRSGPDRNDADSASGLLGQDGALSHAFRGTREGAATITAVARAGKADGPVVDQAGRSDRVTFVADGQTSSPVRITARLKGFNTGAGRDKLTVTAPRAAQGAKARLFRVQRSGRRVLVRIGNLNARGKKSWVVADRNGKRRTTYVVVVGKTAATRGDRSNVRRIR
ncbi:hypothetical protein [Nocardioides sp. SYSU DS0663]|uniref:hypothetical protein n=1 Tax=Nocardioides sp. SYSU DS0663 TaxID=3416445 RepID=UPI003F4C33EC